MRLVALAIVVATGVVASIGESAQVGQFQPRIALDPKLAIPFQPILLRVFWENRTSAEVEAWMLYGIDQIGLQVTICPENGVCVDWIRDSRSGGARVMVQPQERVEAIYNLLDWFAVIEPGSYVIRVRLRASPGWALQDLGRGGFVELQDATPEIATEFRLTIEGPRDPRDLAAVDLLSQRRREPGAGAAPSSVFADLAVQVAALSAPSFHDVALAKSIPHVLRGDSRDKSFGAAEEVLKRIEASHWRIEGERLLLLDLQSRWEWSRAIAVAGRIRDPRTHRPSDRHYWTAVRAIGAARGQ